MTFNEQPEDIMYITIKSPKFGTHDVLIDKVDYDKINGYGSLYLSKAGQFLYVRINHKGRKLSLHRIIMDCPINMVVDHINRNTLDNRKINLRIVTIQENLRNQKRPNNRTGYTGVAIYPGGRFTAQIKHNYVKYHLGIFNTPEEAYVVRQEAERRYWSQ